MQVAVIGARGRLGAVLAEEIGASGHHVFPLDRGDMDIAVAGDVQAVLHALKPDVIVNCSAYNAVDAAETDAPAAYAVNALGPSFLAAAAREMRAILVHFSTDFVFDGRSNRPYTEDDTPNPLSVYGASKLAGEHEVGRTPRHYVLRLESLFGGTGFDGHRATIDVIAEALLAGRPARAMVDRTVSPSYVPDVVRATMALLERRAPFGLYHCVNSGHSTWYDLAHYVAGVLGVPAHIEPASANGSASGAPRPTFCALANQKLRACGVEMPDWRSAVSRHLAAHAALAGVETAAAHSAERHPTSSE